jgi:hypothetical protein
VTVKKQVVIEEEGEFGGFTGGAKILLIAVIAVLSLFIVGLIFYCIVRKLRAK